MSGGLLQVIQRLRHAHGFGVHSPWAYDVVRHVLPDSRIYGWYAYPAIDKFFGRRRRQGRMVYRLLAFLDPASVRVDGDGLWADMAGAYGGGKGAPVAIVDDPTRWLGWREAETLIITCLDRPGGRKIWDEALAGAGAPTLAVDTCRAVGVVTRRHGISAQTITLRTFLSNQ